MACHSPERRKYLTDWQRKKRAKLRWARIGNIDERTIQELKRLHGTALLADDAAMQERVERELKRRGQPYRRRA